MMNSEEAILRAMMKSGKWEVAATDAALNQKENPDFKTLPAEVEAALEDWSSDKPIHLGDLTYLLQRRHLDRYGRIYTFVPVVPEAMVVEKAAARLLNAEIIQAPNRTGMHWEHAVFSKVLRALVRTAPNYVVHAEPKWERNEYSEDKDLSLKGGQALRYYSCLVAYVMRWGREKASIFVSKSRSIRPQRVYTFDVKYIRELAQQYDAHPPASTVKPMTWGDL